MSSRRRRRADSRRIGTECLQCQIHRDNLRGASGFQRALRVRGAAPESAAAVDRAADTAAAAAT
jgi:hypothetical protein